MTGFSAIERQITQTAADSHVEKDTTRSTRKTVSSSHFRCYSKDDTPFICFDKRSQAANGRTSQGKIRPSTIDRTRYSIRNDRKPTLVTTQHEVFI